MKMAGMHYESEHTYFAHAFDLKTPFCEVNMMDDLMTVRTTSHVHQRGQRHDHREQPA